MLKRGTKRADGKTFAWYYRDEKGRQKEKWLSPEAWANEEQRVLFRKMSPYYRSNKLRKQKFEELIAAQNNSCNICAVSFTTTRPNLDHDHATGQLRSLLCSPCNLMLGHAKDNPVVLIRASEYIRDWSIT